MASIIKQLKAGPPVVQKRSAETLAKSHASLAGRNPTVPGGVDQKTVIEWNLKRIEQEISELPGGVEMLKALAAEKGIGNQ